MAEKMTVAKYLTHPVYGCGTSTDVIRFSQVDKEGFDTLKQWARQEMANRGIEVEEIVKK
jgi:hypothetical protein